MKGYVFYLLFVSMLITDHSLLAQQKKSRKQLLELTAHYSPDAYFILTHVGDFAFEKYLDHHTPLGIAQELNTVVHESVHRLNFLSDFDAQVKYNHPVTSYYLKADQMIVVPVGNVFNSVELNQFVPRSLQQEVNRYTTYIGNTEGEMVSSQVNGIYGIIDELCAYYHGTKVSYDLYEYYLRELCPGFKDAHCWRNYFTEITGTLSACYEFKLFLSWYLQYARKHHPQIYDSCMSNLPLRVVFTLLDDLFGELEKQYQARLQEVLQKVKDRKGYTLMLRETNGEIFLSVHEGNGSYSGSSLFENYRARLRKMLEKEEHRVLQTFRVEGVTMENYRIFLE